MIIKNIMEDIVTNAVIEILKDYNPKLLKCSACVEDIVCYVLNRLPAKYITSGRGVLHLNKEIDEDIQQNIDIYAQIISAIKIISEKTNEKTLTEDDFFFSNNVLYGEDLYFNFPYFTGRVITSDNSNLKEDVSVTLFIKEDTGYVKAEMATPNWQNPFIANLRTYGYYTFWVKPIKSKKQKKVKEEEIEFRLSFESKSYLSQEKHLKVKVSPEKARYFSIRSGYSIRIENTIIDLYEK